MNTIDLIAEIGINHDGDIETAERLIYTAADLGFDWVKIQKRTPELCVPRGQWYQPKLTPWGETIPYIEYRKRMEFSQEQVMRLEKMAEAFGVGFTASAWDAPSLQLLNLTLRPASPIKIPSAKLTDLTLLQYARGTGRPIWLSTGMSTGYEIYQAMQILGEQAIPFHCTSTYPCPDKEINLDRIRVMQGFYPQGVGFSSHSAGIIAPIAAAALGADPIEVHVTYDRAATGSDHAASLEPEGQRRLIKAVRAIDVQRGDGIKRVYESELPARLKLRGE